MTTLPSDIRSQIALKLLEWEDDVTPSSMPQLFTEEMLTTHIGKPPCKMAATCMACVWEQYTRRADELIAIAEINRLSAALAVAEGALRPFAKLAGMFNRSVMIEVCEPHPENPSPRIQPMPTSCLDAAAEALATITKEEAGE